MLVRRQTIVVFPQGVFCNICRQIIKFRKLEMAIPN